MPHDAHKFVLEEYMQPAFPAFATRYWGIFIDGELLAVVLYRKGAVAIAELIESTRCGKEVKGAA